KNKLKDSLSNISKESFIHNFENNEFNASDTRTKYILWRLENQSDATSPNIGNINTEHIMPKTLTNNWRSTLKQDLSPSITNDKLVLMFDKNINRIGNFCLLEERWNKRIKNSEFLIKAKGNDKFNGYKDSNFIFTRELHVNY